ncbi:MAG: cupin domain-containing protein [Candidatus Hydrogenedentota bacterium]
MRHSAEFWINHLRLEPHPEGGYFRETHRSPVVVHPPGFEGPRHLTTTIYFLLEAGQISQLHQLRANEMWHFYTGTPLTLHQLSSPDEYVTARVGPHADEGQQFHTVVPSGVWFGATVDDARPGAFSLVACTCSPGFEFEDFKLADREEMLDRFPAHAGVIRMLTLAPGNSS